MKYVMFIQKDGDIERKMPVVFPELLVHSMVADSMLKGPLKGWTIHSAGFCKGMFHSLGGESASLKSKPAGGDVNVLNTMDYLHGLSGMPHSVQALALLGAMKGVLDKHGDADEPVQSVAKPKLKGWNV